VLTKISPAKPMAPFFIAGMRGDSIRLAYL